MQLSESPYLTVTHAMQKHSIALPCDAMIPLEKFYAQWAIQNQASICRIASMVTRKEVKFGDDEFLETAIAIYAEVPGWVEARLN